MPEHVIASGAGLLEALLIAGAVVAHCRAVDQHARSLAFGQGRQGSHQGSGGVNAAVAQELAMGWGPALLSDRLTGQVDHGVGTRQGGLQISPLPAGGLGRINLQALQLGMIE